MSAGASAISSIFGGGSKVNKVQGSDEDRRFQGDTLDIRARRKRSGMGQFGIQEQAPTAPAETKKTNSGQPVQVALNSYYKANR